jgi:hypothetical protein
MSIETLRAAHPWPDAPPDLPEDWFGWFCDTTAAMLVSALGPERKIILECGSFLGFSSRAILENAPNAVLLCADTWRGSPEHNVPQASPEWRGRIATLYEGYLRNLWPWRDRVIPIRQDSFVAMAEIYAADVVPDVVYLDTEHSAQRVLGELALVRAYWPQAIIVGDDFNNAAVFHAVMAHLQARPDQLLSQNASAFRLDPKLPPNTEIYW